MDIKYIEDENQKRNIAREILLSLPEWFSIPEATEDYINDSSKLPFYAVFDNKVPVGFITILIHFETSAEIHVMGVKVPYHRKEIGKQLLDKAIMWCKDNNISYLQVKTLSDLHPDINYAETRRYYSAMGFEKIEVFPELWGTSNPCLMMIKYLK